MSNELSIECPICLDEIDIELSNFIQLECCKKISHIKCLEIWIKHSKTPGFCYYCQQNNNYFKPPTPLPSPEINNLVQYPMQRRNSFKRLIIFYLITTVIIVVLVSFLFLLLL